MAKHRELGLTDDEFELIQKKMGRDPNAVELAMFSLLWSEHCAYKHSKKLLGKLPTDGPRVVMGPGENAGAVDIGSGYSIAFKVESHNHPSAVEPFQGAATGVGGILRDVIALGARPIAILDSLRFGELDTERTRYLVDGVVGGIGHYGNSMGIPTVGGEIYFEPPYEQNCLVNAMCVGIARTDEMVRAAAAGPGNKVVLFGAKTGRDGIGGASVLASAELEEGDASKRPTVQIGDPFEESKVLECSQELLASDLLVSLQDLGAAGLTSSAGEMASAGGTGIDIDVGLVPLREADMEPFEIMVSESQERMLAVVEPSLVDEVLAICTKWQTDSAVIGEVTDTGDFRILRNGETVGEIPVDHLVDGCPLYDLAPEEPSEWIYGNRTTLREDADPSEIALSLLSASSIASKRWAYQQYDSLVGSRTVHRAGAADAAVLNIPESDRAIAISIDGNGRRVACSPHTGTIEAAHRQRRASPVAEAVLHPDARGEPRIEACTTTEDVVGHVQRRVVGILVIHVGIHPRDEHGVFLVRGLDGKVGGRHVPILAGDAGPVGAALPARQRLAQRSDHGRLVEITDDGHLRTIGAIEALVVGLDLIQRHRLEALELFLQ